MTESVLILGASLMQKPALQVAKANDFTVYAVDGNENAPFKNLADFFYNIDLKDKDAILTLATKLKKDKNLVAVFTAGTDFSASVSYVSEKLGFNSHSFDSALNATIKSRMRMCFLKVGIPSPRFFSCKNENEAVDAIKKIGFPCVVKPVDNMGARGCREIRCKSETADAVFQALKSSRSGEIIIEEYIKGSEFSIDALLHNGDFTVTGFADRHIYFSPYFIETGHTMPSKVSDDVKNELIVTFAKAAYSLGLTEGAAKADIKWTKNGAVIGEIAARLSGGYMSGWTFPYSSGLNVTNEALLIACGKEPLELKKMRVKLDFSIPLRSSRNDSKMSTDSIRNDSKMSIDSLRNDSKMSTDCPQNDFFFPYKIYEVPSKMVSAERAWISLPGKIKEILGLDEAKKVEYVQDVFPRNIQVGDDVDFPRNNVEKCGNVISLADDYKNAVKASETACSKIFIRLEKNNKKTDDFLNGFERVDESGFPPPAFSSFFNIKDKKIAGFIEKNAPLEKNIPPEILQFIENYEKDWNYLTILETVKRFDEICEKHGRLENDKIWKAIFRGGIQAAVYVSDCEKSNCSPDY